LCDLLTSAIVEQIRRARAQAEPHLASIEEIARFRAVRMAREALIVAEDAKRFYNPEHPI
jgi:hypothetical protein